MSEELRVALQALDKGAQLLARLGGLNYLNLPAGGILRISRRTMFALKHQNWIVLDSTHSTPFCQTYRLTERGLEQARRDQAPLASRAAEVAVS